MNEIVERKGNGVTTFMTPNNYEMALTIANTLSKSGLIPKDYQGKAPDIMVAMAWGAELGLQPLSALQNIAVINGRPSLWGDTVLALIKTKPDYEYIKESFDEKTLTATCVAKRKNEPSECVATFSKADAERAGLWNRMTWKAYPKRMLQMRARSFAIRDAFPHHLKGIELAEIVQDYSNKPISPINDPLGDNPVTSADTTKNTVIDPLANNEGIIEGDFDDSPQQQEPQDTEQPCDLDKKVLDLINKFQAINVPGDKLIEFFNVETVNDITPEMVENPEVNRFYVKCLKEFKSNDEAK